MATIRDIIGYLCQQYPHKDELSKARLTKMVYLADWKSAIKHGRQMSDIRWIFNHFGPYVDDVINTAYLDEHFNVHDTTNFYGEPKEIISLKKPFVIETLSVEDKEILDFVIKSTCQLTWDDFIRLVYSTFPVFTTSKMEKMDLLHAARRYKDEILTPAMNG
jgi:hypothetical protein